LAVSQRVKVVFISAASAVAEVFAFGSDRVVEELLLESATIANLILLSDLHF
jgi:hypothetical protein